MPVHLTRENLYELVWTKPRTRLARQLGVSDVWIGKQCRALNVPMPPRGYWTNLAVGAKPRAKYRRPPLTYSLAQRIQAAHATALEGLRGFDAANFEQPVPELPALAESAEEAAARYAGLARGLEPSERDSAHHPIVQRLLAEDERRVADGARYSWLQPRYQGADGTYLLRLLDELAWHWTDCGFTLTASRARDVVLSVSCGGYQCRFEVVAAPGAAATPRKGRMAAPGKFMLWLDREHDRRYRREPEAPALVFDRGDRAVVNKMTALLLARWENAFRGGLRWRFEQAAQDRRRALREAEEAARLERERHEAEALALHRERQRLLLQATAGLRRSDEIRALVASVETSAAVNGIEPELLATWKQWVLAQAERMDLRSWSGQELGQWLQAFRLQPQA